MSAFGDGADIDDGSMPARKGRAACHATRPVRAPKAVAFRPLTGLFRKRTTRRLGARSAIQALGQGQEPECTSREAEAKIGAAERLAPTQLPTRPCVTYGMFQQGSSPCRS